MNRYLKGGILILASPILIPAISLQYALNKSWKSLKNIKNCYKIIRSFDRLCLMALFGVGGCQMGMMFGGMIGTLIFPGIGTLVGTIIGGIFGSCVGAGFGVAFSKQLNRIYSFSIAKANECFNPTHLHYVNHTNTEKYLPNESLKMGDGMYKETTNNTPFSPYEIIHFMANIYKDKKINKRKLSFSARLSLWFASEEDKAILKKNKIYTAAVRKARNADIQRELNADQTEVTYKICVDKSLFSIKGDKTAGSWQFTPNSYTESEVAPLQP